MRRTVHLLLLLVALATAAPVAEDADQKSILQMLLTANPHENDIFDNSIVEKTRINDNDEEFSPTTEYVLDSEIEAYTEPTEELEPEPEIVPEELEPEPEPEIAPEELEPEPEPEIAPEELEPEPEIAPEVLESEPEPEIVPEVLEPEPEPEIIPEVLEPEPEPEIVPEVLEPEPEPEQVPEEKSNNATKIDYIVETEQQVEPNFDTEIIEIIQLGEEYPSEVPQSPQYTLNIPEVIPELESTDLVQNSVEDLYESSSEDVEYNNQEWPQRYVPGVPNYFDINGMNQESGYPINNQDWPQRYAPGYPDNQQYEQDVPYIPANPQMSGNIFGNQEFPLEYIPEIQEHNPAYEFADNGPIVDTFPDVYPDPGTFLNFPEINQFGGDGMAHAAMEDITIEPIFFNQEPLIYDNNTPESSMNEELPEELFEILDARFDSNTNPEDNIEVIVLDEELMDMPATPIAGEGEQPRDSPIIATAILQDTRRPDVDMLALFGGPEDAIIPEIEDDTLYFQDTRRPDVDMLAILSGLEDSIIPEIIEESSYPLEEEDFVKDYFPGSEDLPYQTSEQDVIVIATDNDSFAVPNTSEFGEEDFVLDPFANLPPLIVDIEQAAFPDMALVNNPSVVPIENGQFSPMNQNEHRIFFQDEIREFPSEPDFMGPHSHDEFSYGHNQRYAPGVPNYFDINGMNPESGYPINNQDGPKRYAPGYPGNQQFQPHSHGEDMHYHNDMPHTHNDMPHTHNDMPHDYNFENFPQNNYFEDVRGTQKRDGAHIVPDMDMDVDVIELPIIDTGDMGMYNSPLMGSRNPGSTPQITVIIASKPQLKEIWSQFIRPMQQKQYSPLDMTQSQNNVPQFDNMGPYSQNQNTNQFNPNFQRQNFNQQPQQNYNMHQNMNFPPKQSFNSGMGAFNRNFNQQPNMGGMFPNFNMDMSNFNMDMPSFEDLPAFVDEEIERAEQMFASQQYISPYGPPRNQFSNNQQTWPNRYAPNYPEFNYANNGQFYPQGNMNNQFYIP